MSIKRMLFDLLVKTKEAIGKLENWPQFVVWNVHRGKNLHLRGLLRITNYGEIEIGDNVSINSNLESSELGFYPKTILHTSQTGKIVVGDNSGLSNVCINSRNMVKIGKNVRLGAGVKLYDNDFHDLSKTVDGKDPGEIPSKPIIIDDDVFVGAGSIVLKGVHIRGGAVIGAGSVVTKEIPENEVWAGNPAKFIKRIERRK